MLPDAPVAWASYVDAMAWLSDHSTSEDVLAAGFDSMTALYTGRPTVRPFVARPRVLYYDASGPPLGTIDDLDQLLAATRPRYLLLAPMPAFPEEDAFYELVARYRERRPERLAPVYRGADPRFMIFALGGPR
jgi:hypothetical protein